MVTLGMQLYHASLATIVRLLTLLGDHNVTLYQRGVVRRSPLHLRWVPDELVVCDASECRLQDTSMLQDAAMLERRGQGSCGPLAAAYYGWMRAKGNAATIRVTPMHDPREWHAVAVAPSGAVWDPQVIGGSPQ